MLHLIFDTETTNLVHNTAQPLVKQPSIIEFFGLVLDDTKDWFESTVWQSKFNPGKPIPAEVTKITGLTDADVADAPRFGAKSESLLSLLQNVDVIVAHNLSYDMTVVEFELSRINAKIVWPKRQVCTVESTEHIKGYRLNLGALHLELFGESFTGAHRAENDVRALARCYIELVKRGEV